MSTASRATEYSTPVRPLLFAILTGFFFCAGSFPNSLYADTLLDRLEASVNGATVLHSDLNRFRHTIGLREQLDPLFSRSSLGRKKEAATNEEILEFLVDERLILSAFPVTDAEAESEINNIQSNNKIDRNSLIELLRQQGFTFEQYFALIRVGTSKRQLIDREIRSKVVITDDDVKNYYYNTLAKTSTLPRSYHVYYFSVSGAGAPNSPSWIEAEKKISLAKELLNKGSSFEEVAKKYSDDPSATQGGDLGYLSEDQMASFVKEQIKNLRVGETSPILGNKQSRLYLLRLAGIQSQEEENIKKRSDEIRGILAANEYSKQIALWLERQKANAQLIFNGKDPFQKK